LTARPEVDGAVEDPTGPGGEGSTPILTAGSAKAGSAKGRTVKTRKVSKTVRGRKTAIPALPVSSLPDDSLERSLRAEGCQWVAGLDEVGRGAWAGPVSVGVALTPVDTPCPEGMRDSKQVPEEDRETMFPLVADWCVDWSVGHAGPDECDRWGMTIALRLAAHRAMAGLSVMPDVLLLDGHFDYITHPEDGEHRGIQHREDERQHRQMQRERQKRDLRHDDGIVGVRKIFVGSGCNQRLAGQHDDTRGPSRPERCKNP